MNCVKECLYHQQLIISLLNTDLIIAKKGARGVWGRVRGWGRGELSNQLPMLKGFGFTGQNINFAPFYALHKWMLLVNNLYLLTPLLYIRVCEDIYYNVSHRCVLGSTLVVKRKNSVVTTSMDF